MLTIILCTTPDTEVAQRLAHSAIENRLAACVSLIPQIQSIYCWQGKIEQHNEVQLLFKTNSQKQQALLAHLKSLHPYQTPELIVLPHCTADDDYTAWISDGLR